MSFVFAPKGWALCSGQLLPNQNQALFSLLGTTYGGDGRVSFRLADLKSACRFTWALTLVKGRGGEPHALGRGDRRTYAERGGGAGVAPATRSDTNTVLTTSTPQNIYGTPQSIAMSPNAIKNTGGSQPHVNMQPFLVVNLCIALQVFSPQT